MRLRPAAALAAVFLSIAGISLRAQQPSAAQRPQSTPSAPATTLSVQAQLVNLPVIVRDKKGALVQSLTKTDFALTVDGHPATIRYFDKDNNLPLTLGLLVDTSGSVRSALEDERTASEAFLDQMMTAPAGRAPDQAFLIQFAHETELLQPLTSSSPKLREALNQVGTTPPDEQDQDQRDNSGYGGYGHHGGHRFGGTTLYDAVFLASDQLMKKQHGRKALVVLTDGEDRGSMETLASAIAAAQRAETVVYAIYFKGEQHPYGGHRGGFGGRPGFGGGFPGGGGQRGGENRVDGKKVLEQITGETGGRMFEVSGKQTFSAIYTQIAEELRSQYRLGYTPEAATGTEGFHPVELTMPANKKLIVQTRNGYYSGS
ncbi:MAG TPA: VWA domain-containing protein [Acidobacteriaceae bacterium]|jgi:VWFA-related protein|nr:VWA domain-containing protein [Acidobacteriaceae bacterium]